MNCCNIAVFWAIASSCQGSCQRQTRQAQRSSGCGNGCGNWSASQDCGCQARQSRQDESCGSCGQMDSGPVFRYGDQNNSCGCRQNSGC